MTEMVSITQKEYEEYLFLKKQYNNVEEQVNSNLQALKENKVYDL